MDMILRLGAAFLLITTVLGSFAIFLIHQFCKKMLSQTERLFKTERLFNVQIDLNDKTLEKSIKSRQKQL